MRPVSVPARALAACLLLAACPGLAACGGGSNARLEIEIAPTPASDPSGTLACSDASDTFPRDVACFGVTVCERAADGDCDPVPVLRPDDDHAGTGVSELRFSRSATSTISFDVRLEPGKSYDLEIVAYHDTEGTMPGVPYARGRAQGITAGASTIRVRLEPYETWACGGPADGGGAPVTRALHQAVALGNGDVLLLGGVTGDAVSATDLGAGAALQRTIEVYDAADSRFHTVTATDTDGEAGFGAVFHRAFYVGPTSDGRYRVRSVGGFAAPGDTPAARFDAIQGLNHYNSPLLPGAMADVRDSVDIVYDPRNRTAEITAIEPGSVPRAGFDAVSEPTAGLTAVVLGLLDGGGTALRPRPMLAGRYYALAASGSGSPMTMPLIAPRFGATASRLSDSQVLVWGGNVDELTMDEVSARAGEILGSGPVPVVVGGTLPPSTALHTATPIEGGVLIAGGLVVTPVMSMSGGMSTAASTQPLTVISLGMDGLPQGIVVDASAAPDWSPPILHGAVELSDGSVVIAGGSVRDTTQLVPTGSAIRVSAGAAGGAYTAAALPDMIVPRWGHAMVALDRDRVLVTGGFVAGDTGELRAISVAEVLVLEPRPASISSCGQVAPVDGGRRDAGPRDAASDAPAADPDASAPVDDAGA